MITLTTEEAIKELSRYTDQEFYTPQNRAAHQMAIEALERGRWIPVSERLPQDDSTVIYCDMFGVDAAHFYFGKFHTIDQYESEELEFVTHWMPLPAAPSGKDGA